MLSYLSAAKLIHLLNKSVKKISIVRHHNHRTVKIFNGIFQDIFGAHVKVVGRFIHNEQVHRLQQQTHHGKTALFAARQHLHLFLRLLAAKHEGTQQVVNASAHIACCHIVDCVIYSDVFVKQLRLILSKVAYLHIMANLEIPVKRNLVHDALHQR